MSRFTKHLPALLFTLLVSGVLLAGPIKTWSTGDVLTSQDLNANFQHLHGAMVGGHGARLVDADIASGAAISISKLAQKQLLPKCWGVIDQVTDGGSDSWICSSATCVVDQASYNVTSVTRTGTGLYTVTCPSVTQATSIIQVQDTRLSQTAANGKLAKCVMYGGSPDPGGTNVACYNQMYDGGSSYSLTDSAFGFVVYGL